MAFLLRQVLRRLCLDAGWSYAVFWRVAHTGDQPLLEWGDGHCEPMSEAAAWYVLDHVCQAQERVTTFVNRIMVSQILVTGHGIIGTAALAGTYQWLFQHEFNDYGFASKVLDELNQHFSAGMLAVTTVPVLPHGVVQFGSTKEVIEDIAFITHVRNLFTRLGCASGFLLSDVTHSPLNEISVIPSFPTLQSGYVCCKQLHDLGYHSSLESVSEDYTCPILQTYGKSRADSCFRAYKHNQNDDAGPTIVQALALYEGNISGSIQTAFRHEMLCKLDCLDKSGFFQCCSDDIMSKCDVVINTGELGTDDAFAYINHSNGCAIVDSFSNVNETSVDTNPDKILASVIFKFSSGLKGNADEIISSETSSLTTAVQWPHESFDVSNPLKEVAGSAIFDRVEECYARNMVYKSQLSTWFGNVGKLKGNSISDKKRDRAGEGGKFVRKRLRPKDRELIQNRLGELREIVPDGEKITKEGGLKSEVGATWAFEISNKLLTCPIVVHNINPPRLMIVEMLCEEQGFFQEIADFTRGLGLTILKSVMETRNAKVWGYFAIEGYDKDGNIYVPPPLLESPRKSSKPSDDYGE